MRNNAIDVCDLSVDNEVIISRKYLPKLIISNQSQRYSCSARINIISAVEVRILALFRHPSHLQSLKSRSINVYTMSKRYYFVLYTFVYPTNDKTCRQQLKKVGGRIPSTQSIIILIIATEKDWWKSCFAHGLYLPVGPSGT